MEGQVRGWRSQWWLVYRSNEIERFWWGYNNYLRASLNSSMEVECYVKVRFVWSIFWRECVIYRLSYFHLTRWMMGSIGKSSAELSVCGPSTCYCWCIYTVESCCNVITGLLSLHWWSNLNITDYILSMWGSSEHRGTLTHGNTCTI